MDGYWIRIAVNSTIFEKSIDCVQSTMGHRPSFNFSIGGARGSIKEGNGQKRGGRLEKHIPGNALSLIISS